MVGSTLIGERKYTYSAMLSCHMGSEQKLKKRRQAETSSGSYSKRGSLKRGLFVEREPVVGRGSHIKRGPP